MLGEVHSVKICFAYLLLSCSFWSRGLDKLSQTQLPEREAFELSVEKSAYLMAGCCKVMLLFTCFTDTVFLMNCWMA